MTKTSSHSFWALCPDMAEDILAQLQAETDLATRPVNPQALTYLPAPSGSGAPYQVSNGVAVISVEGPIDRKARISFWTGEPYTAGQDQIRGAISAALADGAVKGILLAINSPGGVVAGTKELADFIAQAAQEKPMAAYADGLAASAAYWLASATGRVYAPQTAQVGSIGVIAVLTNWQKAAEKAGFKRTVIHSGKWKAAGSPDKELSEEERALFQGQLEAIHQIFAGDVARHMQIATPSDSSSGWAEGQTFLATNALALGLVTNIVSDLDGAVAALSANIKPGDVKMTIQELKASQPELVEAIAKEALAGQDAAIKEAIDKARADLLALVSVINGEDNAAKIGQLVQSGITPEQYKLVAGLAATKQPEQQQAESKPDTEAEKRADMLEALQEAHGEALKATAEAAPKISPLLADVERRFK